MTFWTVLWVTILSGNMDGGQFYIPYPSEADCNAARAAISETLHYDHSIDCIVSEVPSGSPRPRHQP